MRTSIIQAKIKAFLHDPLHKSLMLMQTSERHEDIARDLANIVGVSLSEIEEIKLADQLASAADRFIFPDTKEFFIKFLDDPIISHPFSGVQKNFKTRIEQKSKSEIIDEALGAIENTLKKYDQWLQKHVESPVKTELLYWLLLRRFNGDVRKEIKNDVIRSIWPFLPAETRIPDHNLWNHLKVTTAISACVSQSTGQSQANWIEASFLLFSLGPVQSFIGTARKTLDHWMGSFLLSYLTFTAMQAVFEEIGADAIIFPELFGQPFLDAYLANKFPREFEDLKPESTELLTPSLPNRFLAIVPTGIAKKLAQKAEASVKAEWENIWKAGKSYFENKVQISPTPYWQHLWERQCKDYFEIYWLVLPWKHSFNKQRDFYLEWIASESPVEEKKPKFLEKIEKFYDLKLYEHPSNLALAYPLIYELAEHLFGARKNWRCYQPSLQSGEPSFKCHLCGEREVLHTGQPKIPGYFKPFENVVTDKESNAKFYIGTDGWRKIQHFWQKEILEKINDEKYAKAKIRKFFKSNERLCAVCATKRVAEFYFSKKFPVGDLDFSYPSTAEMAGMIFKKQILEKVKDQPQILDDFLSHIKQLKSEYYRTYAVPQLIKISAGKPSLNKFAKIDSDYLLNLLGESTWDEISEELEENEQLKKSLGDSLNTLIKKINITPSKLSTYYCYIAMDGDKMGDWVAGKFLPKFEEVIHHEVVSKLKDAKNERSKKIAQILSESRQITPSIHSMLSSVQNQFSLKIARRVVEEENWGKLVYAGGDDVLAMMPVSEGLRITHKLRLAFSGYKEKIADGDGWVYDSNSELQMVFGHRATASLGLVIAHHTTPMSRVIERARRMEKRAKEFGRDALGIALLKRSGEVVQTVVPFKAGDSDNNNVDVVKEVLMPLYRWISEGDISRDFVYTLNSEQAGFSDDDWEMFLVEANRVFERKIKNKNKKKELKGEFQNWAEDLTKLFSELKVRLKELENKKMKKSDKLANNRVLGEILNIFAIIEFMARES